MTGLDQKLSGTASLAAMFFILTIATTLLRFIAHDKQKAVVGPDDYIALASCVGYLGMEALLIYGYHKPSDPALQKAMHPMMERIFLSLNILEVWAFGTVKLSALFFYRRIFRTRVKPNHIFNYVTITLVVIVAAWIITFSILTFNLCGSHNTIEWVIVLGRTAECKVNYPYFQGVSISDFTLDVIIVSLAFSMIWSLSMTGARKIAVTGVFLLAIGGVGASCARMVAYLTSVQRGRAANDKDEYRVNTQRQYYALLEGELGIISVNLPTIWYFVAGITPARVLNSIRSFISLESLRSRGSRGSDNADSSQRNTRTESEASMVLNMADIEGQQSVIHAPDKIHVKHSYEVTSVHEV